jgi:integrase
MKVKLRTKPMTEGRKSLYLDFYPPVPHPETQKNTRREFLKLYVYNKPRGPWEILHNKETLNLAEEIRARRQISIQAEQYGFLSNKKREADFVEYFRTLAGKRMGSNAQNWLSALKYLEAFTGGTLRFNQLTEQFCNDFREYLLTAPSKRTDKSPLSRNSAVSYFVKFRSALKQAYKDGILLENLNFKLEFMKPEQTEREFLTIEELEKLSATECRVPILKNAAIFSALTGLRYSDIERISWEKVQHSQQGYFITFIQKKTGSPENLPISEQAFSLLGERRLPGNLVFPGLKYSAHQNIHLKNWVLKAGISKRISFHNFRHTFASLQFSKGTDIYTISKMLGHAHIQTTEIYTKGDEGKKRAASDRIKLNAKF